MRIRSEIMMRHTWRARKKENPNFWTRIYNREIVPRMANMIKIFAYEVRRGREPYCTCFAKCLDCQTDF